LDAVIAYVEAPVATLHPNTPPLEAWYARYSIVTSDKPQSETNDVLAIPGLNLAFKVYGVGFAGAERRV
jgi:hypothetical protein